MNLGVQTFVFFLFYHRDGSQLSAINDMITLFCSALRPLPLLGNGSLHQPRALWAVRHYVGMDVRLTSYYSVLGLVSINKARGP